MLRKKLREEPPRDGTIFDRPFWRFFSALGDFFLLNIYWLFTSLPLVTIGVSTSALFYVCLKKRRHEDISNDLHFMTMPFPAFMADLQIH